MNSIPEESAENLAQSMRQNGIRKKHKYCVLIKKQFKEEIIKLCNDTIEWVNEIKYLGVKVNDKLNYIEKGQNRLIYYNRLA
jgi:hypothetical protein